MSGALQGVRVVDMTTVVLGPWATQILGDMGAEVIKVETPAGDTTRQVGPRRHEGMGALYLGSNRNKRSLVLDVTREAGREALLRVAGAADVFVHNLRPKVARKLRLEYEDFAARHPGLVYCAAYGYRRDGPYADDPAYDDIIQAASGLADLQSLVAGEPRYVPTVVADKTAALHVVSAILAALFERERGGGGQAIEVPMFESLVDYLMVEHLYGASFDPPIGEMGYRRLMTTRRRPYRTRDGYLAVIPYSDANWQALFRIAGREALCADPRFGSVGLREQNSEFVYGTLAEIIATRTSEEWLRDLAAENIPVTAVNTKEALLDDPQLREGGFWRFVEHPTEGRLRVPDPPTRFSRHPSSPRRHAPRLGEHSAEVLAEAGFSGAEIRALFDAGISRAAEPPRPAERNDFLSPTG